jgi:hypothetical protein
MLRLSTIGLAPYLQHAPPTPKNGFVCFHDDLHFFQPKPIDVQVISHQMQRYAVWFGGSMLASTVNIRFRSNKSISGLTDPLLGVDFSGNFLACIIILHEYFVEFDFPR